MNPEAGGKVGTGGRSADDGERQPERLASAIRRHGLEVELRSLAAEDDPGALATAAAHAGRDVVVAGGDGTVGRAAAGLVESDATLGILPTGSFNNIAHSYGLPEALDAALAIIGAGRSVPVDLGVARHLEDGEPRLFFEAAGLGFEASGFGAIQLADRRGVLRGLHALRRALRVRRRRMRITIDGRSEVVTTAAITVCNGPYLGLGFAIAPNADPTDGVFDIAIFDRMSRFEVLRYYLAVGWRRRRREPRLRLTRGREVRVEALDGIVPVHADGQAMGTTPVAFAARPGALRIFR